MTELLSFSPTLTYYALTGRMGDKDKEKVRCQREEAYAEGRQVASAMVPAIRQRCLEVTARGGQELAVYMPTVTTPHTLAATRAFQHQWRGMYDAFIELLEPEFLVEGFTSQHESAKYGTDTHPIYDLEGWFTFTW